MDFYVGFGVCVCMKKKCRLETLRKDPSIFYNGMLVHFYILLAILENYWYFLIFFPSKFSKIRTFLMKFWKYYLASGAMEELNTLCLEVAIFVFLIFHVLIRLRIAKYLQKGNGYRFNKFFECVSSHLSEMFVWSKCLNSID